MYRYRYTHPPRIQIVATKTQNNLFVWVTKAVATFTVWEEHHLLREIFHWRPGIIWKRETMICLILPQQR